MFEKGASLSESIKTLRQQHGLTQEALADIAGVSLASLSRLERGKETIRLDVLSKVAECLGYQIDLVPLKRKRLEVQNAKK
jgi:transcriptional regulator with XRE-family HTH domain